MFLYLVSNSMHIYEFLRITYICIMIIFLFFRINVEYKYIFLNFLR